MKTLVDGQTCFLGRSNGEMTAVDGLYHLDTRYLSSLGVAFDGLELDPVGRDDAAAASRTLLYLDRESHSNVTAVPDGSPRRAGNVVLVREQQVVEGGFLEQITLRNHSTRQVSGTLTVSFDVDFADIFEVRGVESGIDRAVVADVADRAVTYRYDYRDADDEGVDLVSTVRFGQPPDTLSPGRATFSTTLGAQESTTYSVAVHPGDEAAASEPAAVDADAGIEHEHELRTVDVEPLGITTGDARFDRTFETAFEDLHALTTETEHGPVLVTGVPWFATVFGRDALVSAYQTLPVAPSLARGTLRYLAANQGTEADEYRDEQPGKMLHEVRRGELARRNMIPHTPYYGSVDATPLWIILLEETYRWVDDEELVDDLWDNLERALEWIDRAVDRIGDDPFLYYRASSDDGLSHKAWRDTEGSVQFADGERAEAPLASVEVQGYVYDALCRAASLYQEVRDDQERAATLESRADRLREQFDDAYWLPDREYYGAALTEDGRVVDSLTSNVGQCLWTGIVPERRADAVVDRLLSPELFSGWGIRTTSTTDQGYGPLSYHVGSVWPHDTSLIALGLARYGYFDAVETVATGLLTATTQFEHNRVPELFGGFDDSLPPISYDASCSIQAWAAGSPFALLRALFEAGPEAAGVTVDREPSVVASDAIEPVVQAWTDADAAGLWDPGAESSPTEPR